MSDRIDLGKSSPQYLGVSQITYVVETQRKVVDLRSLGRIAIDEGGVIQREGYILPSKGCYMGRERNFQKIVYR